MPRPAEERVVSRLRETLASTDYRLYPNVRWVATDLLIVLVGWRRTRFAGNRHGRGPPNFLTRSGRPDR